MDTLKYLFYLYLRPADALSGLMDKGNWLVAAGLVLLVSVGFYFTVNAKLENVYRIPAFAEFYNPSLSPEEDPAKAQAEFKQAQTKYREALANRPQIPIVGDYFFSFFTFEPGGFLRPLLSLLIFYCPLVILLMVLFGGLGNFGVVFKREYATFSTCTMTAWAAAHLPFAVAGILLNTAPVSPINYLLMWTISGLLFGLFMVFAMRTVFGANYGISVLTVFIAWLAFPLSMYIFRFIPPCLFSPFLLIFAILFLGGFLRGEILDFGNAMRDKRNLKQFLHNATINPNDADARVQLGLIYLKRRQEEKALEYFREAFEIDKEEIDANYELGKLARKHGDLQEALNYFATVLGQNDQHSLSEIWREVGATYLDAEMLDEAREALEKFIERRPFDAEGLYYLGKVLKEQGEKEAAHEKFREAIESVKTAAYYRRAELRKWSRLAQKEI